MLSLRKGCLTGGVLLAFVLSLCAQQEPGKSGKTSKANHDKPAATPPAPTPEPSASPLSLPADAVVVVCKTVTDALDLVPSSVVLSRKKFEELQAELEKLRRQAGTARPQAPSICQLKGKVEAGQVTLQGQFKLAPTRAGTTFALGCAGASVSSAQLDGQTAPLRSSEAEGFTVQTEKAVPQEVTLDLKVAVVTRGTSQSFELPLPRAAGTTLDLELPPGAREVRVGGHPLSDTPLLKLEGGRLHGGLGPGPVEKLVLTWRQAPASGAPVRTAEGQVRVKLTPTGQTIEADLTLRVEGGPVNEWHVLVPPGAELKPAGGMEDRIHIDTPREQKLGKLASERIVRLKEPSAEPVLLQATVRADLKRDGLVPVGPFFVVDALRQTGYILVRNTVANLHLDFQPRAALDRQELSDEQRHDPSLLAAFRYSSVPGPNQPQAHGGTGSLSWLDIETETIHGQILARTVHTLSLHTDTDRGPLVWHIQTRITATPRWTDVEHLRVQLPAGWESADSAGDTVPERGPRSLSIPLLRDGGDKSGRSPTVRPIDGRYPRLTGASGDGVLVVFPRAEEAIDQGGEITFAVPIDTEVVVHGAERAGLEPVEQGPHRQTWRGRQLPRQLRIDWRPYRPPVQAQSVVDLVWQADHCQVESHRIHFQLPREAPAELTLHAPAGVEQLSAVDGEGRRVALARDAQTPRLWHVQPGRPLSNEYDLTLAYSLPRETTAPGAVRHIRLVVPDGVTRAQARVRVWSDPGRVPALAGEQPGWEEQKIEEVPGRPRLPVLVLQAVRGDVPLLLRAGEPIPVHTVLLERGLVRVQILEGGAQQYHVFFRLRQVAGDNLEVELPAPLAMINLGIWLRGKQVTYAAVNEMGRQTDGGTIARLGQVSDLARPGSLLELVYQLPPSRAGGSSLRSLLQPPVLRGSPPALPLRWQVIAPPDWVLLAPENSPDVERVWTWNGRLLAPQPIAGGEDRELQEGGAALEEAVPAAGLICWHASNEPLGVVHLAQTTWMLLCSMGLVIVGLVLSWAARPQPGSPSRVAGWLLPLLALTALATAVLALLWPTPMSAVLYGCEPGAVVLIPVVAIQWLLHERYRRQIVFLPSFSRTRSGSSLVRGSKPGGHGEPSTVDAPQPVLGSSSGPARST